MRMEIRVITISCTFIYIKERCNNVFLFILCDKRY